MKAICNVSGCGREFEFDHETSGAILCPIGHAHGFWLGTKTESMEVTNCTFENSLTLKKYGIASPPQQDQSDG